jgi:hypothetical protein
VLGLGSVRSVPAGPHAFGCVRARDTKPTERARPPTREGSNALAAGELPAPGR